MTTDRHTWGLVVFQHTGWFLGLCANNKAAVCSVLNGNMEAKGHIHNARCLGGGSERSTRVQQQICAPGLPNRLMQPRWLIRAQRATSHPSWQPESSVKYLLLNSQRAWMGSTLLVVVSVSQRDSGENSSEWKSLLPVLFTLKFWEHIWLFYSLRWLCAPN